jgi:hypothetical protein
MPLGSLGVWHQAGSSAFRTSDQTLPGAPSNGPRWLLGAVYMDGRRSIVTEPEVFLYALPGEDGPTGAGAVNKVTAIRVDTGDGVDDGDGADGNGSLTGATDVAAPAVKFTGYGYVANHNFLHLVGGQTGGPSISGMETFLTGTPPALDAWDAGTTLAEARHLHATAYESAFVYQMGGTTSAAASNTVEQTNF